MAEGFPRKPFFSCEQDRLVIVDGDAAKGRLPVDLKPWLVLERGPGNVLEGRPLRVLESVEQRVVVQCDDGRLLLDFGEGTAKKEAPDGREFVYLSDLEQANEGRGYIPVR